MQVGKYQSVRGGIAGYSWFKCLELQWLSSVTFHWWRGSEHSHNRKAVQHRHAAFIGWEGGHQPTACLLFHPGFQDVLSNGRTAPVTYHKKIQGWSSDQNKWNDKLYPFWEDSDPRWKDCWKGNGTHTIQRHRENLPETPPHWSVQVLQCFFIGAILTAAANTARHGWSALIPLPAPCLKKQNSGLFQLLLSHTSLRHENSPRHSDGQGSGIVLYLKRALRDMQLQFLPQ